MDKVSYPGKMFLTNHKVYIYDKKNDHRYSDCLEAQTLLMCLDIDNWFNQAEFLIIKSNKRCWIPDLSMDFLTEID